jgi:hypothetical protein
MLTFMITPTANIMEASAEPPEFEIREIRNSCQA